MKKYKPITIFFITLIFVLTSINTYAQIGIGTVTPDGVIDLNHDSGTNRYGLVLPRVALTRTDVAAPIVDPDPSSIPGTLPVGTVVYNTVTTNFGNYSVFPGIYMWNGVDWINEFPKKNAKIFKQTKELRTETSAGYQEIPNLEVGTNTFTPDYTGTYKIEVSMNYGGGYVENLGAGTNVATQKGIFKFIFNGVDKLTPLQAWSAQHTSGTDYFLIWEQATIVMYKELVAGTGYSFSLSFDQTQADGFEDGGDSGALEGRGYIGTDIPSSVEIVFLD